MIVDCVTEMTTDKSYRHGEYGSFEHLLFLFIFAERGPERDVLGRIFFFLSQTGLCDECVYMLECVLLSGKKMVPRVSWFAERCDVFIWSYEHYLCQQVFFITGQDVV